MKEMSSEELLLFYLGLNLLYKKQCIYTAFHDKIIIDLLLCPEYIPGYPFYSHNFTLILTGIGNFIHILLHM